MELDESVITWALERVIDGHSYREIAQTLGVSKTSLYYALEATPELRERSVRARLASAESWLDNGLQTLIEAAATRDNAVITAARYIAQECARRAAIRNPAYKEKAEVAITGKDGGPLRVATISASVTAEQAALAYKDLMG